MIARRIGKIRLNGVCLEGHESNTVMFLRRQGWDIELIPPSNTPYARRPDFIMNGLEWEMKSPRQATKIVVERAFDRALRQSNNVVIDLRRASRQSHEVVQHLQKCFASSRRVNRLLIITGEAGLLELKK